MHNNILNMNNNAKYTHIAYEKYYCDKDKVYR